MKKVLFIFILFIGILWDHGPVYADSFAMHTIQPGDTYCTISEKFNTNIDSLKSLNENLDSTLYEGDLIKIQPLKTISIQVDGKTVPSAPDPYIENSRTFVPIRFIADALDVEEINWEEETQTAILKKDELTIALPYNSQYAVVNGDEVNLDAPINIYQGRTFVPIRFVAEAFDCYVHWDEKKYLIDIKTDGENYLQGSDVDISQKNYTDEDLYWLSRIVEAEAQAEPYEGKLAVANVIINRKNSPEFPGTIKSVIFQKTSGYYQFSPVPNGTIYNTPSADSIKAAEEALEGKNNIGNSLFFLNPRKSTSFWITSNRTYYTSIDQHDFYI